MCTGAHESPPPTPRPALSSAAQLPDDDGGRRSKGRGRSHKYGDIGARLAIPYGNAEVYGEVHLAALTVATEFWCAAEGKGEGGRGQRGAVVPH